VGAEWREGGNWLIWRGLFDTGPGQVDVEEEEEDSEADYRGLGRQLK
jgi:hypothetical protein